MSASPMARSVTETKIIPTKHVQINDPNDLPSHYSSTPGGTLYSTTPGGTKIVYEKTFLLNLRNSPISKTPPTYGIPDALIRGSKNSPPKHNYYNKSYNNNMKKTPLKQRNNKSNDDEQFHMEL